MNREAAALGVSAASIYMGAWAAIDEQLVKEGRLQKISTADDIRKLVIQKKAPSAARNVVDVKREVTELILE